VTVESRRQAVEELHLGHAGGARREEKKREREWEGRGVADQGSSRAAGKDEMQRARGRRRTYLRGE
jgi:hypothetical protein